MITKAVSFDIGHTLVKYNNPLSWQALYEPALRQVLIKCGFGVNAEYIQLASAILNQYNTRINPRETEVDSDTVFREIFDSWGRSYRWIEIAKEAFYGFFQVGAVCFDDSVPTLKALHANGIKIGVLTDVAYGMDNEFSLRDIAPLRAYIDAIFTSVDVGYRKPHMVGFFRLLRALDVSPSQMMYVGDEEKDISGANRLGIVSVLIDRTEKHPDFGQRFTISSLTEIAALIK